MVKPRDRVESNRKLHGKITGRIEAQGPPLQLVYHKYKLKVIIVLGRAYHDNVIVLEGCGNFK